MNIEELSAIDLGRKISSRELSSEEVTAYFVGKIDATDGAVNAFTCRFEEALSVARRVDADLSQGKQLSPLAGVPIAVKDVLCIEGAATTCGSKMLKDYQSPYTATAAKKLIEAGMVVVGKTNMDEFAMGGSTETSAFGETHNPWDLSRTAGGSSGGSAAALAAGMAPLTIGSDTGGSVRQPAAFCGVCGLKPTYGRISRYGLVAFASSLDQVGPFAHHVEDLAASLQVMAGHDKRDSTSVDAAVPDYSVDLGKSLAGLKVGVIREQIENDALSSDVRQGVERCGAMLKGLGAELVDVHLKFTDYSVPTYYLVAPSEASGNLSRYDGVHYGHRQMGDSQAESPLDAMIAQSRSTGFGAEVKRRIMLGTFALSAGYYDAYYKKALQVRRLIAEDYRKLLGEVDILLGPVAPTTAYPLGEKVNDPVQMYLQDLYTVDANLAGIPALSLPAGNAKDGMPLAVQLQGRALDEAKLLNVAFQLEKAEFFTPRIAQVS